MPALRHLKVTRERPIGATRVEIDGTDYANTVTGLTIDLSSVSEFTRATVEMGPFAFTYDGPAALSFGKQTRAFLLELGWTPPVDDALEAANEDLSDSDR